MRSRRLKEQPVVSTAVHCKLDAVWSGFLHVSEARGVSDSQRELTMACPRRAERATDLG